jgi:2-phospho-L-lactate guanylyltransferase
MSGHYALLVPVKTWERAKSRLGVPDPQTRERLVRAFAHDAVAAAIASEGVAEVYVVTDEPDLVDTGYTLLPDLGEGDLNRALSAAAVMVAERRPTLGIAAMCADVPCLVASDLTIALAEIRKAGRSFVADAAGTGTTLLAVPPGFALDPHFGIDSARRHLDSGARGVTAPVRTLRLDVDTTEDLVRAVALGVGEHTTAALRE